MKRLIQNDTINQFGRFSVLLPSMQNRSTISSKDLSTMCYSKWFIQQDWVLPVISCLHRWATYLLRNARRYVKRNDLMNGSRRRKNIEEYWGRQLNICYFLLIFFFQVVKVCLITSLKIIFHVSIHVFLSLFSAP